MSTMRAMSARGLLAMVCSLLLVHQPISGLPRTEYHNDSGSSHGDANTVPALIAVAKLTGSADRNGRALINGSIVSSGDSLQTHTNSAVLLTSAPQEQLWLGPNTSAKLSKNAGTLEVALERGTVSFESNGHIQVSLQAHDGLTLRSRSDSTVRAQLSFFDHRQAQVKVQQGLLELVEGDHSIVLRPNSSNSLAANGSRYLAGSPAKKSGQDSASQVEPGSIDGTVVNSGLFAVPDAKVTLTDAAGKVLTTKSSQEGRFSFTNVTPGSYTLHVEKTGFDNYELPNVVVRSGNESSLYVQLAGGAVKAGSTGKNSILLWVIIGGAAAGGIGAYLGTRGSKSTTSPSSLETDE
jgi:hypothetical protein